MALSAGTRLGPYEVLALIGAGGMGEVYRATDTNLKRAVALKVLAALAADAERLARFQREAEVLAALNHPNIAAIYGLERSGATTALVMELVEGEDLSQRIARGAIPIADALPIARQIADALEAAHEQGIIHRDLKPANVKARADGMVKVLDFGLAKAMEPAAGSSPSLSQSPTITSPAMTQAGVILGTAAYMSPEQARGKTVDKRADIWAFGAVLFEMLTGRRAFAGEDITDTIVAVISREPDWPALPPSTSASVRSLLRRCLDKDPKRRLRDIGEARLALEGAFELPSTPATPAVAPVVSRTRERVAWAAALGVVSLAALALAAFAVLGRAPAEVRQTRFFVSPPDGWRVTTVRVEGTSPASLAVSPDGSRIAFLATAATGGSRLWVRALDTLTAQELLGTDGAISPFWSPDSRFLGFFADGKLKKIAVSGGPAVTLCDSVSNLGGTWNREGVIVFSTGIPPYQALQKVSASGGVPSAATKLGTGENWHGRPSFLPDGRHFIYRVGNGGLYVTSLDSPARTLLLKNPDSTNAVYARGHLLFLRETTLMAQRFDLGQLTLTGEPIPIAEQIQTTGVASVPLGTFSASENGVLVYQTGMGATGSQLVWFDRSGKQLGVLGEPADFLDIELSPDGKQASVSLPDLSKRTRDIWLYDVARGLKTRFTFDPGEEQALSWSPDSSRVVFNSRRKGQFDLYQKAADGSGTEEVLLEDKRDKAPMSWSADGKSLLYASSVGLTGFDLFVLPLSGDRKPVPFLNTPFNEPSGAFSPDGRWVAYVSNESGREEVYVAPFPGPGGKRQVSTAGGRDPRWRRDGTEIFYLSPDNTLMAAAVNGRGASFEVGVVKPLFETRPRGVRSRYAVTADGQRFLINTASQAAAVPITVVVNWDQELKAKVPTK